jgi:hypothetical protein
MTSSRQKHAPILIELTIGKVTDFGEGVALSSSAVDRETKDPAHDAFKYCAQLSVWALERQDCGALM